MKCPICNEEMTIDHSDESHNPKTGARYTRTLYWCSKDDVWISAEVPIPEPA